ncbi:MFS transporter [Actinospica durhamensis]|uniref:MFS transporter n=1 Tax=Actinospica durhamensis TaxID=1508375 RepID=A0A941IME0_9ACTN|nr:MFS transporter [Actinospica durhamensis]MBR7834060.1 MFS transporter [Actinospica durhamensis]
MAGSPRGDFAVLRHRDFRILLGDRLLAPLASAFSLVGASFAVLDATGSTTDLSYVLAAQLVPSVLFMLLGGVAADRFRPQRVIIAANLLVALGEGSFGLLMLLHTVNLPLMLVLEFCTGIGTALFWPASMALLPKIVPAEDLQTANALSRLVMNGAQIGGAAMAGVTVAAVGPGWALSVCGFGMLGTVPLLTSLRAEANVRPQDAPGLWHELREGWHEFRSLRWVWVTVLEYLVINACWYGGLYVLGPAIVQQHLGGPAAWGWLNAAFSAGLILGGAGALRYLPKRPMLAVAGLPVSFGLSCFAIGELWPLWAVMAVWALAGVCNECLVVSWNVSLARFVRPERLARVSAYDGLGSTLAMPLGALAAGPLSAHLGAAHAELIAFVVVTGTVLATLACRDVWTMRLSDAPDWSAREPAALAGP